MRLSRRDVIRLGVSGLAALSAGLPAPPPLRADDEAPRLRSDRFEAQPSAEDGSGYLYSAVYRAPYAINALGAFWSAPLAEPAIRTSRSGNDWTPWRPITRAEDHAGPDEAPDARRFGDLHFAPGARYAQLRWRPDPAGEPAGQARTVPVLEAIDSVDGPGLAEVERGADLRFRTATPGPKPVPVVSRAGWGAEERLRYDAKGNPIWPFEYRSLQKCIVHHTGTELTDADYPAAIRAIYRFHAVTREWGDIGYNFLIDPRGNVYEGRAGGPNVVAGHALQYNWGSVGIAVLGDYDDASLPAPARNVLVQLIAWKAQYLNPHEWSYFADRELPHLFSHRDCLTTGCPGDNLYSLLPDIRDRVIDLIGGVPRAEARVTAVQFTPDRLFVGGVVKLEVTIENTGTATLPTARPKPGLAYLDGESFASRKLPTRRGTFRIGVDLESNRTGTAYPYRWGLDDALEPGKSGKVSGYVRITSPQQTRIWAALLLEDQPVGDPRLALRPIQVQPGQRVGVPFLSNGR